MEKTNGEALMEKLFYKKKHAAEILSESEVNDAFEFCKGYREFLDFAKTERRMSEGSFFRIAVNSVSTARVNERETKRERAI